MNTKNPTLSVAQLNPTVCAPSSDKVTTTAHKVSSVQCISVENLSDKILGTWLDLFERSTLDSPYYHPAFTKAVAAVRDDVEIAILRKQCNQIVGILPFQRESRQVISPIGGRMNDFHCIVADSKLNFDWSWLLDQVRAQQLKYHAWTNEIQLDSRFDFEKVPSYYVDMTEGFDEYLCWVRNNSTTVKRLPQKIRSLERRVGPIRFEFDCNDDRVLEELIQLKSDKFRRTNTFDIFSVTWAVNLLREIFRTNEKGFGGLLSALWAGNTLVAAQFGMIHDNVLQYWFPVFNPEYAKYSPGLQLMLQSCRSANERGIQKIDMSYGQLPFKDKFCNRTSEVSIGLVDMNVLRHSIAKIRYKTRVKLKSLPFKEQLKVGFRRCFPKYGSQHFK